MPLLNLFPQTVLVSAGTGESGGLMTEFLVSKPTENVIYILFNFPNLYEKNFKDGLKNNSREKKKSKTSS